VAFAPLPFRQAKKSQKQSDFAVSSFFKLLLVTRLATGQIAPKILRTFLVVTYIHFSSENIS